MTEPGFTPAAGSGGGGAGPATIADGSVTPAKLSFDPATQAELDAKFARTSGTVTTASLAANAAESGAANVAGGLAALAFTLATNRAARVRFYSTVAKRDADAARLSTTDPTGNHGCLLEVITSATALSVDLAPVVGLHNEEATRVASTPYIIDNLDTVAGAVTVTVSRQVIES